jgi:transketolase
MNTGKAHGAALGEPEVRAVKEILGFDPDKTFQVDDEVLAHARKVVDRGRKAHEEWTALYDSWAEREPERKDLLERLLGRDLPIGWEKALPSWEPDANAGREGLAGGADVGDVPGASACKAPTGGGRSGTRRRSRPR